MLQVSDRWCTPGVLVACLTGGVVPGVLVACLTGSVYLDGYSAQSAPHSRYTVGMGRQKYYSGAIYPPSSTREYTHLCTPPYILPGTHQHTRHRLYSGYSVSTVSGARLRSPGLNPKKHHGQRLLEAPLAPFLLTLVGTLHVDTSGFATNNVKRSDRPKRC